MQDKWTLCVSLDSSDHIVYAAEYGHTDTKAPRGYRAVHVVPIESFQKGCPKCGELEADTRLSFCSVHGYLYEHWRFDNPEKW